MLEAVLFDFDLTLADSTAGAVECTNHALASLGYLALDDEAIRRTVGLSLAASFRTLTGSGDPVLAKEFSRRFIERADQVMAELTVLYESVPAVMAELRRRRLRTAVVSTKFRYRIEAILRREGMLDAVDVIVGGDDVKEHKPHPEGIERALGLLGVPPSRAVYVGDHTVDAEAAASARVPFIGVLAGMCSRESLDAFAPVAILESVLELPAMLGTVGGTVPG